MWLTSSQTGTIPNVSMKSGLEDRNNINLRWIIFDIYDVSMKSGLEDRNNPDLLRTPEPEGTVSMKSGLEDRNNVAYSQPSRGG